MTSQLVKAASVKLGYVANGGRPLQYMEWGATDSPPLILIAPIRHSSIEVREVAELLADRYRVIGVNLRGHPGSSPFLEREYDPRGYSDDIDAFVTELQLAPVVIMSFSVVASGAAVGYAGAHPDRAKAIILFDGGLGYAKETADAAGKRVRAIPAKFANWQAAVEFFGSMEDQICCNPRDVANRAPYLLQVELDGSVTWKYDSVLRDRWPGELWQRNTGDQPHEVWGAVKSPMLVVRTSSATHLVTEQCEELVRRVPGASWVAVTDVRTHFAWDENPSGLVHAIEPFLTSLR